MVNSEKKILCICPIGIGNYLLFYPACVLLKKRDPSLRLHVLGLRGSIGELAGGDPLWSGVTVFDPTRIRGIVPRFRIAARLRRMRFDASLCFFPSNRWEYNLLPALCAIPARWGFEYPLKKAGSLSFLLTKKVGVREDLHDLKQNLALAGAFLGAEISDGPAEFPVLFGAEEGRWAEEFFRSRSSNPVRIGIHPGSSAEHGMEAKRWAPERFAALADRINAHLGAEAYIFGGPEEGPLKKAVLDTMRTRGHLVAPETLRRTAALLGRCALCVCNDSGLMHLAACQGTPTVGIFGPTDERRNGPWGPHSLAVRKPMEGFPLWTARTVGRRRAPEGTDPRASLEALDAGEAWEKILPWLEREELKKGRNFSLNKNAHT
jgi:ADP-heptose:LPS heptosyltransferase